MTNNAYSRVLFFVCYGPDYFSQFAMIYRRPCSRNMKRFLSTDSRAYSKTLLLPKTPFPQWVDPQKSEKPFRDRTTGSLYKWQVSSLITSGFSALLMAPTGEEYFATSVRATRWPALRERTFAHGYVKNIHSLSRETHFLFVQDMPSTKSSRTS